MIVGLFASIACVDGAGTKSGAPDVDFAVLSEDVGDPIAVDSGFDAANGDALGAAFSAALPVFGGGDLAWSVPNEVWTILQGDLVRDNGVCPYRELQGDVTVYQSDCRSSQGYEWSGDASERTWTESGVTRARLDADLEVIGDADDVTFDRIRLSGAVASGTNDDGVNHIDVNMLVEVAGYWQARAPEDPRGAAWTHWVMSGRLERDADGKWQTDLAMEGTNTGGLQFVSRSLAERSSCPVEVVGEAVLGGGVSAQFEGADSCDACADIGGTSACAP